jgi:tetratricopeptide (TPR) repeat protein
MKPLAQGDNNMKCRYELLALLAVVLIVATGCVMLDFDLSNLGHMSAELGICNQSISDYTKIIKKNPEDYGAYLCRGKHYHARGKYDQAIADYSKAIEIFPESRSAYYSRGIIYYEKGLYDMAISDYAKAIEMSPKDARPYNNLAWILSTCPNSTYRNGAEALELARKAAEIQLNACHLDTLAAAYAEVGKFEDAVKTQDQAIYQWKEKGGERELTELMGRLEYYKDKRPWRE